MLNKIIDAVRSAFNLPPKTAPAVPFSHPSYGDLIDDGSGMHAPVKVEWLGLSVDYYPDASFGTREQGAVINPSCFTVLDTLMADQTNWQVRVKAAVLEEIYPTYLDYWHDPETGPALSEEAVWSQLRLESISTDAEGGFGFVFEFGDEFPSAHVVDASGSLEAGVESVMLAS